MNIVHSAAAKQESDFSSQRFENIPYEFTAREIHLLYEFCSDLTYKELAAKLQLSRRTIEGYRNVLCEKIDVRTRVGLVLFAISNGVYQPGL